MVSGSFQVLDGDFDPQSDEGKVIKKQIQLLNEVLNNVRAKLEETVVDPQKLMVDNKGGATISNDGATIMKLLDVVHPAAKTLVDIAKSQDADVGDGTTSVVILAGGFRSGARV